jgi:hypothetical protein
MIVRYSGHFTVSGFIHAVQFYESYSIEEGLGSEKIGEGVSSKRMDKILKEIGSKLTKEQKKVLKQEMSNRGNSIIDEQGKCYSK